MTIRTALFFIFLVTSVMPGIHAEEAAIEAEPTPADDRSRPPRIIFKDGIYADAFTDFSLQTLSLLDEATLQLALKVGWQLLGNRYVSLAGGYGFSSMGSINNRAKEYKRYNLSYHGPVGELQIMPSSKFYGVVTGYGAKGSVRYRKEGDDPTSKAMLKVGEVSAGVFFRFKYYFHAGLQVGQHQVKYREKENFDRNDNASSTFYSLSLRGSTL